MGVAWEEESASCPVQQAADATLYQNFTTTEENPESAYRQKLEDSSTSLRKQPVVWASHPVHGYNLVEDPCTPSLETSTYQDFSQEDYDNQRTSWSTPRRVLSSPRRLAKYIESTGLSRVSPAFRSLRGRILMVKDVVWDEYKKSVGNGMMSNPTYSSSRMLLLEDSSASYWPTGTSSDDRPSVPQSWIDSIQECVHMLTREEKRC